jgi:hypothetical protein
MPTLYLNNVNILLSSRFILNCFMQFCDDEPHVNIGWPGTNTNESIAPYTNY